MAWCLWQWEASVFVVPMLEAAVLCIVTAAAGRTWASSMALLGFIPGCMAPEPGSLKILYMTQHPLG